MAMAQDTVDSFGISDVLPSFKHFTMPSLDTFVAIGTNYSHLPIPPGSIHKLGVDNPLT